MSELLKKYESIDQSKVNEATVKILNRVKTLTNDFTADDAKNNEIAKKVIEEVIKKNPDAVKVAKAKKTAKAKKSNATPKKSSENNIMAIAKSIRKDGESFKDAMERAKKELQERKKKANQKSKTELEKLFAIVKTKKELKGFGKSDILRDSKREAKPRGARVVTKEGTTSNQYGTFDNKLGRKYWESRERHSDRLAPNYPKDMPLLENGGMFNTNVHSGTAFMDNAYFKKGGMMTNEEKMVKELHKLQRELNSSRLRTYREGDTSEEEMARQRERASKLARFNDILQTLRSKDAKFELGGAFMTNDLAGHTGGGDGGLNRGMPLDGFTNTYYTGLVGETGAMSSGELFENGGYFDKLEDVKFNFKVGEKIKIPQMGDDGKLEMIDATILEQYPAEQNDGTYYPFYWVRGSWDIEEKHKSLYDEEKLLGYKNNPEKYLKYELGGAMMQNQQVINDASQPYVITEAFGNPAQQIGMFKYGGKTKSTPSMRELYIDTIAVLTNTRSVGVDAFAKEHNLTDSELSNLMTGLGRKMISQSDFITALVGDKGNPKQKEVVAFAKSDKAYKMADGGMFNTNVHSGTAFMDNAYFIGGGQIDGEFNKKVQKLAEKKGFTMDKLGRDEYDKVMTQALRESLTDANYHLEARDVVSKAEKKEWSKDLYESVYFNPESKVEDFAREVSGLASWDGDYIVNAYYFVTKMQGSKVATMIDDLFLKKSKTSKKPTKYIDHDDIKTVTVIFKGKKTIFKGEDVFNGANMFDDGGDLSSKANYIPKRDVIEVELKNGETIKPVNGYWIKKGAKPIKKVAKQINKPVYNPNKAHYEIDSDGIVYVDSNFLNMSQNNLPNSELKHYGFGEFYLDTPEGKIDFIRTQEQREGFVGRVHKVSGDKKLIDKLIESMREKDKFANGGNVTNYRDEFEEKYRKLDYDIKLAVIRAVGVDDAMEFYDADYPIRPSQLIMRAVRSGFITIDDINKNVVESAMENAEESEEMEEIGSSDFTYFLKSFLEDAGFKVGFVNNSLQRLNADGSVIERKPMFVDGGNLMSVHDGTAFFDNPIYAENGTMVDEQAFFMRDADGNRIYSYPNRKIAYEGIEKDIDLSETGGVRAKLAYTPKNRTPDKLLSVNPRAYEYMDFPMPTSAKHKND